MAKTHKIVILVISAIVIVSALIGFYIVRSEQYERGFSQLEIGQSKQMVIGLMGNASEKRSCSFPIYDSNKNYVGDCSEIFSYRSFYQQWELAFDRNGKVIEKYYWFLGEYGNRPLDLK